MSNRGLSLKFSQTAALAPLKLMVKTDFKHLVCRMYFTITKEALEHNKQTTNLESRHCHHSPFSSLTLIYGFDWEASITFSPISSSSTRWHYISQQIQLVISIYLLISQASQKQGQVANWYNSSRMQCPPSYYQMEMALPCIITTFRIISNIIKQTSEIHKNGSRSLLRNQVGLHFLWRSIWGNCDRANFQANMISLTKSLNQGSTLEQAQNSSFNSLLLLQQRYRVGFFINFFQTCVKVFLG